MHRRIPPTRARSLRRSTKSAAVALAAVGIAVLGTLVTSSTPAAAAGANPSGWRIHRGDLPADKWAPHGWRQVFADTFDTSGTKKASASGWIPDNKWWGYTAGTKTVNSINGVYDSSRVVSISGSMMQFNLHSYKGVAYAAVEAPKLPAQTYGRYSVRYRYVPGYNNAGFKSVWMLWPDSNHWGDGEIDIHEYANQSNRTYAWAAMHQACGNNNGCPQQVGNFKLNPTAWHTATLIWAPGVERVYNDGHLVATTTKQVPTKPMHLLLQTEGSSFGPKAKPGAVVKIQVDWVTVYKRK